MDATKTLEDDRVAFSEIAQSVAITAQTSPLLAQIKKQCEDRIVAIDAVLQDV